MRLFAMTIPARRLIIEGTFEKVPSNAQKLKDWAMLKAELLADDLKMLNARTKRKLNKAAINARFISPALKVTCSIILLDSFMWCMGVN